jgi:hypothetical protein
MITLSRSLPMRGARDARMRTPRPEMHNECFADFKKTVLALALLGATGAANAGLSFSTLSSGIVRTEAFNTDNAAVTTALGGLAAVAVGSSLNLGYLQTDQAGTASYSYLGQESGYADRFFKVSTDAAPALIETDPFYKTVSAAAGIGKLNFMFEGDVGRYARNNVGSMAEWSAGTSIGLLGTNLTIGGHTYQYVIGYNDSAGAATLGDWDDFVVGVNFIASAVPEPGTWAMLLAGLGLLGWSGRRDKLAGRRQPV